MVGGPGKGIVSWTLDGTRAEPGAALDGLTTGPRPEPSATLTQPPHPNGVVAIDHLVVFTPDLERTVSALTEAGCQERRRRRSATYGREMVQAFFRLGEVVLEVVSGARPAGDGPARFFGLAFTVADLDALREAGSFHEIGTLAGRATYAEKGSGLTGFSPTDFVMGRGRIQGRPVVVGGDDFTVRGGAADAFIWQKQAMSEQMANELRLPMVRLIDGSGGGGSVRSVET